jgi:hypothetical protein
MRAHTSLASLERIVHIAFKISWIGGVGRDEHTEASSDEWQKTVPHNFFTAGIVAEVQHCGACCHACEYAGAHARIDISCECRDDGHSRRIAHRKNAHQWYGVVALCVEYDRRNAMDTGTTGERICVV